MIPFDFARLPGCSVLVVGDVMLDRYVWGGVARISPEAPVPVVHAREKTAVPGGAANVAANVVGLGARGLLVGVRGDDGDGDELERLLAAGRIDHRLLIDCRRPTSTKTRIIARGQQLLRLDEEQTGPLPDELAARLVDVVAESLGSANIVVLSDYGKGVLSVAVCRRVLELAAARDLPVIVDPKGSDWEKYAGAACVTPNTAEFAAMVGGVPEDPLRLPAVLAEQARGLRQRFGFARVLLTRGAAGMMLVEEGEGEALFIPSAAREVFDVSGAGDTVVAVLAGARAAGLSWPEAARLANAAAGTVVAKVGTRPVVGEELRAELARLDRPPARRYCAREEAAVQVRRWQAQGQRVVFTNGCFDLLHAGHIKLIESAARFGDRLVIGLNADASVRRLKGEGRPILSEDERATLLSALAEVDLVVIFAEDTPLELIDVLGPDVLVKGSDYNIDRVVGRELVERRGGRVELVDLRAGHSTTSIVARIAARERGETG
ncbi:MAG: D-glycero-beta-D-manno-heptose-7-phosphate kinase [Deltaproteobacteria bacterium]|nr:D-glycero-beta-D-manno-heptose-7-phosphate kinase [Candidatus Anaeroferrophillacea bacterium]